MSYLQGAGASDFPAFPGLDLYIFCGLPVDAATLTPWRVGLNYPSGPFGTIFAASSIILPCLRT